MIKDILKKHNLYLESGRDQFYMDSERILDQEVEEAGIEKGDVVLEIGAGVGTLTKKLAEKAKKVYAIENDPEVVQALKEEIKNYDNIEIIPKDALKIDFPEFDKCVSNIPYSISSEVIEKLSKYGKLSVISLQKEFAERLVAEPGSRDYSRITIRARFRFLPVMIREVSRDYFFPKPDVDSAIVKLYPRKSEFEVENEEFFFKTVKALFIHKNKKVRNSFYDSRRFFDLNKDKAKEIRDDLPNSEEKVFTLNIKELAEISKFLERSL